MKLIPAIAFCVLLLSGADLKAQFYSSGQDPASIRWRQVKTPQARFVFPAEYEARALALIRKSPEIFSLTASSLQHTPRRIPILMHHSEVISNGFVTWAPRRSELYLTPPQDQEATPWLSHLLTHEYRHVVQVDMLNQGMTKALGYVLGEQAAGAVLGLYIPLWFLEGDAVVTETALSRSGRGRLPSFSVPLRAQLKERGHFEYEKAVFGSYREFVPDHYILGYHLVGFARAHYGPEIWHDALNRVARRPWSIRPFSSALKKHSGMHLQALYDSTMDETLALWAEDESELRPGRPLLSQKEGSYMHYRRPGLTSGGQVVAARFGLEDIDRIVIIDSLGQEKILHTPGFWFRNSLNVEGNQIAWTERRPHPRWENKAWSEIHLLDIESGAKKSLGIKGRYFSPAIHPDGRKLAAVYVTVQGDFGIDILDIESGNLLQRLPGSRTHIHWMQPAWHPSGDFLVLVVQEDDGKKGLTLLYPDAEEMKALWEAGFTEISDPVLSEEYVWFNGAFSGEDGIYRIDLAGGDLEKVAISHYGLVDPFVDAPGQRLWFSDYTDQGYQLRVSAADSLSIVPATAEPNAWMGLAEKLSMQEVPSGIAPMDSLPESKPYSRLASLFHIHSWAPLSIKVDDREVYPGFSILSQNLLSTSFFEAGYAWIPSEERGEWYTSWSYQGWFPRLQVEYRTTRREAMGETADQQLLPYAFREDRLRLGGDVPLRFVSGPWTYGLQPSFFLSRTSLKMEEGSPFRFRRDHLLSLDYRIYSYRLKKRAYRDLQAPWGQTFDVQYRHDPWYPEGGGIFAAALQLYFPGLFRHHGLRLYQAYQYRVQGDYFFGGLVRTPTGYESHGGGNFVSFLADYRFPLAHPDWNLPGIVYLKRLKAGLFYDYGYEGAKPHNFHYTAFGAELRADAHFFRFIAPVDIGGRLAWRPETGDFHTTLFLGVDFSGF